MIALKRNHWIVLGLFILLIGNVIATRETFTRPFPGHNDFMTPFEATRAFWLDGLNPYGEEATDRIQQRIFGREPLPEEDPGFFSYPFYATFMIAPLVNVEYSWASAIWMVLLEVCLIGALILAVDLFKYRVAPLMMTVFILWILVVYPGARGLILGQLSHIGVLLEILTLWALAREREGLAGVALALSTFKPQMGYLLVPFLLLWGLQGRRWQFIGWFTGVFLALLLGAFVLFPSWFAEWMNRLSLYPTYTRENPVQIITGRYLDQPDFAEWLLTAALHGLVLWSWWMVLIKRQHERFLWAIMWTITITHLAAPRTATPHFVLFIFPLLYYFSLMTRRIGRKRANRRILLVVALTTVLPWIHFLATVGGVAGEQEDPSVHVLMPILMIAFLWFTRQTWWDADQLIAPRSPQTLLEVSSQDELRGESSEAGA